MLKLESMDPKHLFDESSLSNFISENNQLLSSMLDTQNEFLTKSFTPKIWAVYRMKRKEMSKESLYAVFADINPIIFGVSETEEEPT